MTIHWKAPEGHFLMVPLVFPFNHVFSINLSPSKVKPCEWGTDVKTNTKGGADAQLCEKQCMWRHLRPERATTSFQMRHSHCSVDIAFITELCISTAYRISSSGSSLWWLWFNIVTLSLIAFWGWERSLKYLWNDHGWALKPHCIQIQSSACARRH
jgi:hypothetical protein